MHTCALCMYACVYMYVHAYSGMVLLHIYVYMLFTNVTSALVCTGVVHTHLYDVCVCVIQTEVHKHVFCMHMCSCVYLCAMCFCKCTWAVRFGVSSELDPVGTSDINQLQALCVTVNGFVA